MIRSPLDFCAGYSPAEMRLVSCGQHAMQRLEMSSARGDSTAAAMM
jgi:hypothetical protein